MRDAQKDLELCDNATLGPWFRNRSALKIYSDKGSIMGTSVLSRVLVASTAPGYSGYYNREHNAEFIVGSREALPYWIERATEAEKLIEQAAEEIENCYGKETELSKRLRDFLGDDEK